MAIVKPRKKQRTENQKNTQTAL